MASNHTSPCSSSHASRYESGVTNVPQQLEPTSATVASPESLPVSIPPAPPATVAPPESSPAPPPSVEVPVQQQQQPRVSPAVTRSAARQRGGLGPQHGFVMPTRSEEDMAATVLSDAWRLRRQRKLDAVEIPDCDVTVTDELLGKGGFGAVYLADYNGRNAAAKVAKIEHDFGKFNSLEDHGESRIKQPEVETDHNGRRKAFWREVQAMMRLSSPHTVNFYGVVTSRKDRLVLVMELLAGGDLRAMLRDSVETLAEPRARRIISDMCAGMSFLHRKETIHGDLKSANVLLDGTGRAKISDFGTSKWPRATNSTGLLSCMVDATESTQMSYAWAAPEVLDTKDTSYASDVYSFGVVVWEILSGKIPWADESRRNIYTRVVVKNERPQIPAESPADLANIARACWHGMADKRPTFSDTMRSTKWE
eukprot:jgi/Undpi1/75/HiC_scaffold_1.g00075.m1